jgi:hypothetical protein
MRYFILLLSFFLVLPAHAADDNIPPPPQVNAIPEQPDIPASAKSGETLEPDITITRKGQKTIQEFSRGGRVYMIKVIPDIGPPYYFMDVDGDGNVDMDRNPNFNPNVNLWKIVEWD